MEISSCSSSYTSKTSFCHWPEYTEFRTSMNEQPEAITMNAFSELIDVMLPFQTGHISMINEEIVLITVWISHSSKLSVIIMLSKWYLWNCNCYSSVQGTKTSDYKNNKNYSKLHFGQINFKEGGEREKLIYHYCFLKVYST